MKSSTYQTFDWCLMLLHIRYNIQKRSLRLTCFIVSCLCVVGMATCYFFSLQELLPPQGRWWTRPPRTHLHQYHLSHPPLHPPWSLVQSRHPRSRRTRSISIWPNKMVKSTGTKIPSCKSPASLQHQPQMSDIWSFNLVTDVTMAPLENVCTVYR